MMIPIAAFPGPDQLGVLIPIVALLIPIVAILTKHQIKMAAIIHGRTFDTNDNLVPIQADNNSQVGEEVRQLRELMHQQTIALDNLRQEVRSSQTVQDRINQNS